MILAGMWFLDVTWIYSILRADNNMAQINRATTNIILLTVYIIFKYFICFFMKNISCFFQFSFNLFCLHFLKLSTSVLPVCHIVHTFDSIMKITSYPATEDKLKMHLLEIKYPIIYPIHQVITLYTLVVLCSKVYFHHTFT